MKCPSCGTNWRQMKAGFNHSGNQQYKYGECKRAYTPVVKEKGYAKETRMLALRMYMDGNSQRGIARILKISPKACRIGSMPTKPQKPTVTELDELYTFVKQKKQNLRSENC